MTSLKQKIAAPVLLDSQWHLDKKVPIAVIVTILLQTGAIIWWAAGASERLTALERQAAQQAPRSAVDARRNQAGGGYRRYRGDQDDPSVDRNAGEAALKPRVGSPGMGAFTPILRNDTSNRDAHANRNFSTSVMLPAMMIANSASAKTGEVACAKCQRHSRNSFMA